MAASLLDAIDRATAEVGQRRNALHTKPNNDAWDARFLEADNVRLDQLGNLRKAMSDPSWTSALDDAVKTQQTAGEATAAEQYRQSDNSRRASFASRGTAGGSMDAIGAGKTAQQYASAKAQVAQQVSELRAAGIADADAMGQELLNQILAGPDDATAMGTSLSRQQGDIQSNQRLADVEGQFRSLLSNSLAGFVNTGLTPAVTGGFQAAGNYNTQLRQDYLDAKDSGQFNGSFNQWAEPQGGTRNWWGF